MNGTSEWIPISKVSEKLSIPPETVRRYARQYGAYLTIKRGEKKAYLIHESSLGTIKKIRTLLEQGHQHGQVKLLLNKPREADVQTDTEETVEHQEPQLFQQVIKEIQMLAEKNEKLIELMNEMHERMNVYEELFKQQQQLAATHEQVDEPVKEQRDYERKRDEYLVKTMNEMQEKRKESANPKEKNRLITKLFKLT